MGVPGFWGGWLRRFFIDYREFRRSNIAVNTFSIDMNGVLHTCLNKINSDASADGSAPRRTEAEIEDSFMQEIHRELTKICNKFCRDGSCQVIIICVDGVSPVAKMMQQRSRRFKAVVPSSGGEESVMIDRNSLSPGTRIMDRIQETIAAWGRSEDVPPGLELIISPHRVPGEGEHKIFQLLKVKSRQDPHLANLIYGIDADFTMISLASDVRNIWLVREEEESGGAEGRPGAAGAAHRPHPVHRQATFLSIESLRKSLKDNFMGRRDRRTSPRQLSDDFVAVMSLLGNDFVPRVPDVGDVSRWIGQLLTTYRELGLPLTERTVEGEDSYPSIILENFKTFLGVLSQKEGANLAEIATARFKYPATMVIGCSETKTGITGDSETSVNVPLLKKRWYARTASCVGMGDGEDVRDDMCLNFLKMISWVLLYYGTHSKMSRTTFYPFHFAPFVSDLARVSVFKASVLCRSSVFKDRPWLFPIEQAVLTQPKASAAIILDFPLLEGRREVADLLDDAAKAVGPTIIEGKNAEHQGTTIVKIPDFGKLSMIPNPPPNVSQTMEMMQLYRPKEAMRSRGTTSWADRIELKK